MSARSPDGRDLPLIAWGDELRRRKIARRTLRLRIIVTGALLLATSAPVVFPPVPLLVWNASPSVAVGFYWISPARQLGRGDLVVTRLSPDAARLAATRGYLPLGVPVMKHVAGLPGDRVCGTFTAVTIEGSLVARRLLTDRHGRFLPAWLGCTTLRSDQVLLINPGVPDSFDGRYFGPTRRYDILGQAHPLWLR